MSVNHCYSDLTATFIWSQQLKTMETQPSSQQFNPQPWLVHNFNLNRVNNVEDDEIDDPTAIDDAERAEETAERESMFEKALTPSDVGKLNRLVIPKQYAEKYFPIGGGGDSIDKGLLLSFEDEGGKSWRFRYSYWNSSQSYVLTKGWSRYVKEKRLESGDVVSFQRYRTDGGRFFIGWKRRPAQDSNTTVMNNGNSNEGNGGLTGLFYSTHPYPIHSHHLHLLHHNHPPPYQPDCLHSGSAPTREIPTPAVGNSKILRLFGVNMECQTAISGDPPAPSPSFLTNHQFFPMSLSSNPPNHTGLMFSQDVDKIRNRRE